jgi:hypothetical protein
MGDFLRLRLPVGLLLALAACGGNRLASDGSAGSTQPPTNPGYEQALTRWVDRSEEDLVAAWGVPERSQHLTDGGQAFEYRRAEPSGKLLCSTLFTSDVYGKIRTWSYRGSDCRAPRLGDYGAKS